MDAVPYIFELMVWGEAIPMVQNQCEAIPMDLPLLIVPNFAPHVFSWKRSSWCRRKHVNNKKIVDLTLEKGTFGCV